MLLFASCFLCFAVVSLAHEGRDPSTEKSRFVDTLRLHENFTCDVCVDMIRLVQDLLEKNATEDDIIKVIVDSCILLKIEDENVCSSIVPLFAPEVFTVLEMSALSPTDFCGFTGICPNWTNPDAPWNVSFPVPKPPLPPPPNPQPSDPVRYILHVSDIHWDPLYTEGLATDCGEPLCCRPPNAPGAPGHAAGPWGDYNCDIPVATVENFLQFVANMTPKIDMIFWTGDIPPHNVWNQSRSDQLTALEASTNLFLKYLPDVPVFPALGNHESSPVNSFPPPFIEGPQSNEWLLDGLAQVWSNWLPSSTLPTIEYGGFYSVLVEAGLRILSINANYCGSGNLWLFINETDPAGELQWLVGQLQAAENNTEKVYILTHIPPGDGTCLEYWSANFYAIVDRYEGTIAGVFSGHTHKDEFHLYYDQETLSRATNVNYVGGSLTTYTNLNPGFRVYTASMTSTKDIRDFSVYILNMTEANLTNEPQWVLEYSAKETYGMEGFTPADWDALIQTFETDDSLFQDYYSYRVKSAPVSPCTGDCKTSTLCQLRTARSHDNSFCRNITVAALDALQRAEALC